MLSDFFGFIFGLILSAISKAGYLGVFFLMFLQSANIPIPSEITMPFAGFLAFQGKMNFYLAVLAGALGNLAGAFLSYRLAGRLIVSGWRERSKFLKILISEKNLALAQRWFEKYGGLSVFFGRLVPVVNCFISFPAGLAKMNRPAFLWLTFAGSLIWSFVLAGLGYFLGVNWFAVREFLSKFDVFIAGAIVVFLAVWIWRKRFKAVKKTD